jgi:hypothetical protein
LIKLFRWVNPFSYFTLLLYTCFIHLSLFFSIPQIHFDTNSFLGLWLLKNWVPISIFIPFLTIANTYFIAIFFLRIILRYRLYYKISLLPAYIFITLSGIHPELFFPTPVSISLYFMIFILNNLFRLKDLENATQQAFFISVLTGIGFLFYSPFLLFMLLFLFSIPILKNPLWQEIVILPLGFLTPVYLIGLGFYLNNDLSGFYRLLIEAVPVFGSDIPGLNLFSLSIIIYAAILIFISYLSMLSISEYATLEQKRMRRVLLIYFLINLFIIFFTSTEHFPALSYLSIPSTILLSNLYIHNKYIRMKEFLFYVLLLSILSTQWYGLITAT